MGSDRYIYLSTCLVEIPGKCLKGKYTLTESLTATFAPENPWLGLIAFPRGHPAAFAVKSQGGYVLYMPKYNIWLNMYQSIYEYVCVKECPCLCMVCHLTWYNICLHQLESLNSVNNIAQVYCHKCSSYALTITNNYQIINAKYCSCQLPHAKSSGFFTAKDFKPPLRPTGCSRPAQVVQFSTSGWKVDPDISASELPTTKIPRYRLFPGGRANSCCIKNYKGLLPNKKKHWVKKLHWKLFTSSPSVSSTIERSLVQFTPGFREGNSK